MLEVGCCRLMRTFSLPSLICASNQLNNKLQLAPRFKDPPHAFRNQTVNNNQSIVLDIRFLKVSGSTTHIRQNSRACRV